MTREPIMNKMLPPAYDFTSLSPMNISSTIGYWPAHQITHFENAQTLEGSQIGENLKEGSETAEGSWDVKFQLYS